MQKYTFICLYLISVLIISCTGNSYSGHGSKAGNKGTAYSLKFNPDSGMKYYYDITRTSAYKLKVNDQKIDRQRKLNAGIFYNIEKDSSGNFTLTIKYDKIQIDIKNGDRETKVSTTDPVNPFNPVSSMLHALKDARISATVTPSGTLKSISGYKDIKKSILSNMNIQNAATRRMARQKLNQLIGDNLIKKNVSQLFNFLPDSAVRVGDQWNKNLKQTNGITMHVKTTYTLESADQEEADIALNSEIDSDNIDVNFMSMHVTANLKGSQEGKYHVETTSGMLMSGEASSNIKGTLQMMGREIPIEIENDVTIKGRR